MKNKKRGFGLFFCLTLSRHRDLDGVSTRFAGANTDDLF